jgi:hypothetical protein
MPDLATAFLDAKLVAELRERQRSPESRKRAADRRTAYDAPRGLKPSMIGCARLSEDDTLPCFDPWLIAKAEPNRENAAYKSLRREGFEAWFPAGRRMKQLPQRFVSSKNRHKKRHVVLEDLRLPYAGYLFFRRLTKHSQAHELGRLYELDGVLGLCMFGETIAIAENHEIQMLRFKEDIGAFDKWDIDLNAKAFALSEVRRTDAAKERWEKPPQLLGTLDTNRGGSLYLVEAFGRITRVVAATGAIPLPETL